MIRRVLGALLQLLVSLLGLCRRLFAGKTKSEATGPREFPTQQQQQWKVTQHC